MNKKYLIGLGLGVVVIIGLIIYFRTAARIVRGAFVGDVD